MSIQKSATIDVDKTNSEPTEFTSNQLCQFFFLSINLNPFLFQQILKQHGVSDFYYGWSYILAWLGIGQCLIASFMFLGSARCIRSEKRAEHAKNMQYLMPVYPDKRNPYGYAYAYPGPYSYHGSSYGITPYSTPY